MSSAESEHFAGEKTDEKQAKQCGIRCISRGYPKISQTGDGRSADSAHPGTEPGGRFLRPDPKREGVNSKKLKPAGIFSDSRRKNLFCGRFSTNRNRHGIAEFYLNPPRHIAVREGVRTVGKGQVHLRRRREILHPRGNLRSFQA